MSRLLPLTLLAIAFLGGGAACGSVAPVAPVAPGSSDSAVSDQISASASPTRAVDQPVAEQTQVPPAVAVLGAWDAQRAAAWARADTVALGDLYVPGSRAGRRDLAMLRAWTARGLRVRRMKTQVLAVREVARSPRSWTLRVTERLMGGVAIGPGIRRPLPRDGATTRTVRLSWTLGGWRVAAVRAGR